MTKKRCPKCGSEDMVVSPHPTNPHAYNLYCKECGTWIKFANKEEVAYYSNEPKTPDDNKSPSNGTYLLKVEESGIKIFKLEELNGLTLTKDQLNKLLNFIFVENLDDNIEVDLEDVPW